MQIGLILNLYLHSDLDQLLRNSELQFCKFHLGPARPALQLHDNETVMRAPQIFAASDISSSALIYCCIDDSFKESLDEFSKGLGEKQSCQDSNRLGYKGIVIHILSLKVT